MCVTKPLPYAQSPKATITIKLIIVVNIYVRVIIQQCYTELEAGA
jgi:hypothetical protein